MFVLGSYTAIPGIRGSPNTKNRVQRQTSCVLGQKIPRQEGLFWGSTSPSTHSSRAPLDRCKVRLRQTPQAHASRGVERRSSCSHRAAAVTLPRRRAAPSLPRCLPPLSPVPLLCPLRRAHTLAHCVSSCSPRRRFVPAKLVLRSLRVPGRRWKLLLCRRRLPRPLASKE